jgi:hypothetical protein
MVSCQLEEVTVKHRRIGRTGLLTIHFEDARSDLSIRGIPAEIKNRVTLVHTTLYFVPDESDLRPDKDVSLSIPFLHRAEVCIPFAVLYLILI